MKSAKQIAREHWNFIKKVLETHGEDPEVIKRVGFHYRTAFVHGYGHGLEARSES